MLRDFIIFDTEVFPEWNCLIYGIQTPNSKDFVLNVLTSDDPEYVRKVTIFSDLGYLTGFNIKQYDLPVIYAIMSGYTPAEVYELSMSIINNEEGSLKFGYWSTYMFCDLFDDLKSMGSLKVFESNTGLPIRETTIPFGKTDLTEAEKQEIIEYCKMDVLATNELFNARAGYVRAKANCTKLSDLSEADCLKNSSSKVLARMMHARKKENPNPPIYKIPETLNDSFEQILNSQILDAFKDFDMSKSFDYSVRYMKNDINYGAGGIHGTYADALYAIADDEYAIFDADFQNLYPALLDNFNYYATGIPEDGKDIFRRILGTCRSLKAELKKVAKGTPEYNEMYELRDSTKLLLNASTGSMRMPYSALYDPQNIIALCMTGQLIATYMAKILHNLGALIIQLNTDGVIFKIKRTLIPQVQENLNAISTLTNIPIDLDEEYALFQKDVNNYILYSSKNSKPKLKGRWAKVSGSNVPLTPLNAPVINNAIIAYYKDGTAIDESIKACTNALDFMITTTRGPSYAYVTYQCNDNKIKVPNVNRVYASTNKSLGKLYKVKLDNDGKIVSEVKIASLPENCGLWPDAVPTDIPVSKLIGDIDYNWYISEALKHVIDMIKI